MLDFGKKIAVLNPKIANDDSILKEEDLRFTDMFENINKMARKSTMMPKNATNNLSKTVAGFEDCKSPDLVANVKKLEKIKELKEEFVETVISYLGEM
mmetsp:Transcript_5680/g.9005  ORF Transcript_5680/g.9005 Transcript_5680/m.9005 type:complete len:98 (+) Transcript_5680:326-619(+)